MFWRQSGTRFIFSSDAKTEQFSLSTSEFADIAFASAWPRSDSVIVTAAHTEADRADVQANRKGNYRAYRISARDIQPLTQEYTNTAISLPNNRGIAYSNGAALVVIGADAKRQTHKIGRFNWGPTSLSCNESGSLIGIVKWKGDDRKLAYLDARAGKLEVSSFSHYSYVLFEEEILYVLGGDVMCFSPATRKARSITPAPVQRTLLELTEVGAGQKDSVTFQFGSLSLLETQPVSTLTIADASTYEALWHGLIALPFHGEPAKIIQGIEPPWHAGGLASTGDVLCAFLDRHEKMQLVETRTEYIGRASEMIADGWTMIATPRLPESGFQFLPQ